MMEAIIDPLLEAQAAVAIFADEAQQSEPRRQKNGKCNREQHL